MTERAARRAVPSFGHPMRKIKPLPGVLRAEWIRCGKAGCRCERGERHGPYLYHRWYEDGRQRRRYVRAGEVEEIRAALAAWRRLHPPARSMRALLADLRRLSPQLDVKEV
jgi:hypothetical protein